MVAAAGAAAVGGMTGAGICSGKDFNSMGGKVGAMDNIGSGSGAATETVDAVGGKSGGSGTVVAAAGAAAVGGITGAGI